MSNTANLSIQINDAGLKKLEAYQAATGLSLADVFNEMICIYGRAIEARQKGRSLADVNEKGGTYNELWTPGLRNVKPKI